MPNSINYTTRDEFRVTMAFEGGTRSPYTFPPHELLDVYFIEDIFSFNMVGKMVIIDKVGLTEFAPITGNEKIQITYGEYPQRELMFTINSIKRVDSLGLGEDYKNKIILEITFVDDQFYNMNMTRYSYAWPEDTLPSDIVRALCEKAEYTINKFEDSDDSLKLDYFYVPYWTVGETVKWLMKRMRGSGTGQAGYLLWNTPDGMNFVTLDNLLLKSSEEDEMYVFETSEENYKNYIISWEKSGIDRLSRKGISGGLRLGFDFETKAFIEKEYTYSDRLAELMVLGKTSLFDSAISNTRTVVSLDGEKDEESLLNHAMDDFSKRYSLQNSITVVVRGLTDRYAGKMIEVFWPSIDKLKERFHSSYTGNYLIKSITHHFSSMTLPTYVQKMVLLKNGHEHLQASGLEDASKTNIARMQIGKMRGL